MVAFRSRSGVEKWAKRQPPEKRAAFSARCAARLFPVVSDESYEIFEELALAAGRAILSASVRTRFTNEKTRDVSFAASAALLDHKFELPTFRSYPIVAAAHSSFMVEGTGALVESTASAYSDGYAAALADANALEAVEPHQLFLRPLWPKDATPSSLPVDLILLQLRMKDKLDIWDFWQDWYQGLIEGRPPNWDLWRDIALIPDADWALGAVHIAGKIEDVKARLLEAKLPMAETVEFNRQSGKFFFAPQPIAKSDLLGATLSQAADALEDALTDARNGLQENSRETRVLRRTFARYGNDPQRIEMDFTTIHAGLVRQIATDELPASEENLGLIRALEEGALGIRATHPDVAQNRKLIETQAFAELPQAALDLLSGAMPILVDITEGQGQLDWQQDIPAIVDASKTAPPSYRSLGPADRNWALAARDEKVRVIGRAARMYLKIKETPELIHEIDKNTSYKGARILATLHSLISFGRWIVSFF